MNWSQVRQPRVTATQSKMSANSSTRSYSSPGCNAADLVCQCCQSLLARSNPSRWRNRAARSVGPAAQGIRQTTIAPREGPPGRAKIGAASGRDELKILARFYFSSGLVQARNCAGAIVGISSRSLCSTTRSSGTVVQGRKQVRYRPPHAFRRPSQRKPLSSQSLESSLESLQCRLSVARRLKRKLGSAPPGAHCGQADMHDLMGQQMGHQPGRIVRLALDEMVVPLVLPGQLHLGRPARRSNSYPPLGSGSRCAPPPLRGTPLPSGGPRGPGSRPVIPGPCGIDALRVQKWARTGCPASSPWQTLPAVWPPPPRASPVDGASRRGRYKEGRTQDRTP